MNRRAMQLSAASLEAMPGWAELEKNEQSAIRNETQALNEALYTAGNARLAIGEHLSRVRDVLGAKNHKGMWEHYLATLHFSRATAHRYIQNYEVTRTILPKPVLQVAMMRGVDTIPAKMVEAMPPPRTTDPAKIGRYLDKLAKGAGPQLVLKPAANLEMELRKTFNVVRLAYDRVALRHRDSFMERLIAMEMSLAEMPGRKFEPESVPAEFVVKRGRPPKAA